MGQPGKPTQNREEGPNYRDISSGKIHFPKFNPYFEQHREFGVHLLPADVAAEHKADWEQVFDRVAPLHLEVGAGNGFFLEGIAKQHPEADFVGVEIRYKRVVIAATKLRNSNLSNARVVRYDARHLTDLFKPHSLEAIYVNHPDPWPKKRHAKNRIISRWFLELAGSLLKPGGEFRLKTDHRPHIDALLDLIGPESDGSLPYVFKAYNDDENSKPSLWNDDVETNYQKKFQRLGLPVYAVAAVRDKT